MENMKYAIIGIDGGASKASGWIIDYTLDQKSYQLSEFHKEIAYSAIPGYLTGFKPLPVATQLSQQKAKQIIPTTDEIQQGKCYIEATFQILHSLLPATSDKSLLIGIGMPGLKRPDRRGIEVIANGPRILNYCQALEDKLYQARIPLFAPIDGLGSDADYCGIGERFAAEGAFCGVQNAYYLGGGSGAADALLLKGQLIPFDQIKTWMAKTWEMKNQNDISFERYASASGLRILYNQYSGKSESTSIYGDEIATRVLNGDEAAKRVFKEVAENLALLLSERITTLFCGAHSILDFVNPQRQRLETVHSYRGTKLDRIVIGQRLGDLMASKAGNQALTKPLLSHLSYLLSSSDCLSEDAKHFYLDGDQFRTEILVFSRLRAAPALGAGIAAHQLLTP
jgi:predicted NBD/HSP70 family sugar kinase